MKHLTKAVGLLAFIFCVAQTHATEVQQDIDAELAFLKRVFQTGYAPGVWKQEYLKGWSLDGAYQDALAATRNKANITAVDYRHIIANFLGSTRDYHVGVQFASTESAKLPFSVRSAEGRYFVVATDQARLTKDNALLQVGDEVIGFGGRPIADVVNEIAAAQHGMPTTDHALAEMYLTQRTAARGMEVPRGNVEVVLKRAAKTLTFDLTWEYAPETIPFNPGGVNMVLMGESHPTTSLRNPQFAWGAWDKDASIASDNFQIGGRKSYVPTLGDVIWRSADSDVFDAYIYRNEAGKLIGYVRIPHYGGTAELFPAFKQTIARMQKSTDKLVIDEINNPGGSLFYIMALVSVLSDKPVKVPDHHMAMFPAFMKDLIDMKNQFANVKTDEEARAAWPDETSGYPVTYQRVVAMREFFRDVEAEYASGKHLSRPMPFLGMDRSNPDPEVNYTKPILVLTNELDFSGGDFFPAILQDNKLAKVFGQRTSGAGGYVEPVTFPSSLGLTRFSFTGSLARRVNYDPIENLGITPDIPYAMTMRDMTEGFVDYKNAINAAVNSL